jgi:DNA-binding MarR family transcriptional regulator
MAERPPGYELPLLLFAAFRSIVDATHADLAAQGHPGLRPMHGFVFQAIGVHGTTAVQLAARLGVTKQAAGKTIATLEKQGYLERAASPHDARAKIVRLTGKGIEFLELSARAFDEIQAQWAEAVGEQRLTELRADLRVFAPGELFRLDAPGWFGSER